MPTFKVSNTISDKLECLSQSDRFDKVYLLFRHVCYHRFKTFFFYKKRILDFFRWYLLFHSILFLPFSSGTRMTRGINVNKLFFFVNFPVFKEPTPVEHLSMPHCMGRLLPYPQVLDRDKNIYKGQNRNPREIIGLD